MFDMDDEPAEAARPSPRRSVFPGFADIADHRDAFLSELVAARRRLGLSQTEVAARMGTSQSAVARMESGDADMRISTAHRYAAALGAELRWRLEDGAAGG